MCKIGIFIAGYRWSGSGAVTDWLGGHNGLCRVKGSEAAFGEIRAVNYGLRFLVQTAAGRIPYGERLGRWALCPDPKLWRPVLGDPMTACRGSRAWLYKLIDYIYINTARFFIIPGVTKYKEMLDAQLGRDFREDEEYLDLVKGLTDALRLYMQNKNDEKYAFGPEHDEDVRFAASGILSVFYRRFHRDGRVLIFDNAISGLNPELFHLLHPAVFPGQVIIFVRRDPRDQFAELVKYSGSTFPWSAGKFIKEYRHTQEKSRQFIESIKRPPDGADDSGCDRFVRQISFESFVLDKDETRSRLKQDLQKFWKPYGIEPLDDWLAGSPDVEAADGMNGYFNAERSKDNIGIWRTAGLAGQMRRISKDLTDFIEH